MQRLLSFCKAPYGKETMDATVRTFTQETGIELREICYRYHDDGHTMSLEVGQPPAQDVPLKPPGDVFTIVRGAESGYDALLYLPQGYEAMPERIWPLLVFLHGIGERGGDPYQLAEVGLPRYLRRAPNLPMIVVAPQCPAESHWAEGGTGAESPREIERLMAFVREMKALYQVDATRVYLTGLSMGGRGAWKLACAMPDTFAAVAPICGRADAYDLSILSDMPIWMFHGVQDAVVSFDFATTTTKRLLAMEHADFRLTVYPAAGHDAWTPAYQNPALYEFFMQHTRHGHFIDRQCAQVKL